MDLQPAPNKLAATGELEHLSSTLQIIEIEPGAVLFHENEPGDSLYIVIEGKFDVVMAPGTRDEKVIATLGPGEFMWSQPAGGGLRARGRPGRISWPGEAERATGL